MAASGRYARGSVLSALNLINLSSHTVSPVGGISAFSTRRGGTDKVRSLTE